MFTVGDKLLPPPRFDVYKKRTRVFHNRKRKSIMNISTYFAIIELPHDVGK